MNFWQIFLRVLPWRPRAAAIALWWQLCGRKVRARNCLRSAGAALPFAYNFWIRNVERQCEIDQTASAVIASWEARPTFVVIIDGRSCLDADLERSILSVQSQTYPQWDLLIVCDHADGLITATEHKICQSWAAALARSSADFLVPLRGGDRLSTSALFHFAQEIQSQAEALVIFGDEDQLDSDGSRRRPWFKPRWNEELFLARDYISRACAINMRAAKAASPKNETGGFDAFRLILAVLQQRRGPIVHVPRIITHVCSMDEHLAQSARVEAVQEFVASAGAIASPGSFGSVKVSWPLPSNLPLVSVIVPTKDKLNLLRACIDSLLSRTTYQPFEILIVDNGSVEQETLEYLDRLENHDAVRVLRHPAPYSYSALNNYAARRALGSYLCLLNNDTEVIQGNWLTEMMRYAVRSDIGAVGAKLLYPDGTIQHAGVIVGIGDAAGHAHRNLPSHESGYFGHAHTAQFVSAVTGACLLVDKEKFFTVDGLDEESLPIAYNDVDLCLKLEKAGWRNVYVPHAVLIHHESKSRAKDHSPKRIKFYKRELQAFQERWGAKDYDDPQLNPNLDRSSETFVIRF